MPAYTILVSTEPYKYQVTDTLLNLCQAILDKGNIIKGIFFYGSGVYNIKKNISCGTSIRNVPCKIEEFATINNIPVAGCSTWVSLTGLDEKNFIEGANEEGLGDFSDWAIDSDKIIIFGPGS